MIALLSAKRTCLLAWAVTLFLPIGLLVAAALPWFDRVQSLDDEIATLQDQMVRYRRLLRTLPALEAELKQVRSNEDVKAFYFDAKTPALAGALLQGQLQDIVKATGARLISTQILPGGGKDEHPARVRIRTQMQCETDALFDVLYGVEQARPFLFVDQLSVRSTARSIVARNPRFRRRAPVRRPQQGQLTVRLDVFGFALEDAR
ncbi:MAG: type II secretion system protein GspM [Chromatiaceae bacterium]